MNNKERIERIVTKLQTVKQKGFSCFGSDSHQFNLNPVITKSELENFEKEHGITLPEDYLDFLLYAGNGGAGPYYGIYPLEKWASFAYWNIDTIPTDFLRNSNSFKPGKNIIPEEFSEDDAIYEQQHIDIYQGTIAIGTQGCTYDTLLVVSGLHKGRVVYADADDSSPYMCRDTSFLNWYERWLDELLKGYSVESFGYGPGGDAEELFRIIETSDDTEEVKEAFYAFGNLPEVDENTFNKLLLYVNNSSDEVREAIYWVIWKGNLPFSNEQIENLLKDSSPGIRERGIWFAEQKNFTDLRPQLLEMALNDPDKQVAEKAYLQLIPSLNETIEIPLSREEILQLLKSRHDTIRIWAIDTNVYTEEDIDLLISFLTDKAVMARAYAIKNLHRLKAVKAIPALIQLLERERNKKEEEKKYEDCYVIDRTIKMFGELSDKNSIQELLLWAEHPLDDVYRYHAATAITLMGDERITPILKQMLTDETYPERYDVRDKSKSRNYVLTMKELIKKEIKRSPNPKIRELA